MINQSNISRGLTEAQRRNLESVRDHGKPTRGSPAAYHCRIAGWSEFVWLFEDGTIATTSEKSPCDGNWLVKIVGEKLTDAGRAKLQEPTP